MTEPKKRGRKRIHPEGRKRRNVNIERDAKFDAHLASIMSALNTTQTDAIKTAVEYYSFDLSRSGAN